MARKPKCKQFRPTSRYKMKKKEKLAKGSDEVVEEMKTSDSPLTDDHMTDDHTEEVRTTESPLDDNHTEGVKTSDSTLADDHNYASHSHLHVAPASPKVGYLDEHSYANFRIQSLGDAIMDDCETNPEDDKQEFIAGSLESNRMEITVPYDEAEFDESSLSLQLNSSVIVESNPYLTSCEIEVKSRNEDAFNDFHGTTVSGILSEDSVFTPDLKTSYKQLTPIDEGSEDSPLPKQQTTAKNTNETPLSSCEKISPQILSQCFHNLSRKLPKHWHAIQEDSGIQILKFSPGIAKVLQRSIYLSNDCNISAFFHGKALPREHSFYNTAALLNVDFSNPVQLTEDLIKVISEYRLYEVCTGVSSRKFKPLWHKEDNGFVDSNAFQEIRYSETCRSKLCDLAVPQLRRQCTECYKLHKKFSARAIYRAPYKPATKGKQRTANKYKPLAYLISPERNARLRRYRKVILNLKRVNERLSSRLEELIAEESVEIDTELGDDLIESLQEADREDKLTDFHKLFLQQQLKAAKVKGSTGMRWHPMMVRFALQLKMLSSTTYETMVKSGFIRLPSDRTLFDYSHAMATQEGCHSEIIKDVAEVVHSLKHDYQRFHSLMFDEVHISQNLVQQKSTGKVIGYCNLNAVQGEILEMENKMKSMVEGTPCKPDTSLPMVKTVLSFMVKGTASGVENVVASYGVSNLTKEDLHEYTWEVIENLEMNDIRVSALVGDGSSVNRGFFDMQPPATETDTGVIFDTLNVYAPERKIYFISDPPHLMKTIRNCLYNSGKHQRRNIMKNGESMQWSTIVRLFKHTSEQTIKKLPKLTAACVFLNSHSRMKVAFAARVLSKSVALVLRSLNWPNSKELSLFGKV